MNANKFCLDEASRAVLRKLAQALLPLNEWIQARGKTGYTPPDADTLPWRENGVSLSTDQLGVIEFVEALLRESSNDVFLLERWRELQAEPLKYCPIDNKNEWRGARGLDAVARFGAVESENAPADYGGYQIARSQLYMDYLPLLSIAANARGPQSDADWNKFALELFKDSCAQWPQSQCYPSSKFMLQLLRDMLYAVLGMRNPVPEPWRSAVLTEIGEFRRPGNVYTRADIERGLSEFTNVLASYPVPEKTVEESLVTAGPIVPTAALKVEVEFEPAASLKAHYLKF